MSGNDYKSTSPEAQLGGARRKNGHKTNCTCHICENMKNKAKRGGYEEDMEKEQLKKMGGSKKKNGHKPDCGCPICKNMKHAKKRGGNNDVDEIVEEVEMKPMEGGRKKKGNGHKADCKCPICMNMKKSKKGGEDPDTGFDIDSGKEIIASDDEYDSLVADLKGEEGVNTVGGTRKRRGSIKKIVDNIKNRIKSINRTSVQKYRRRTSRQSRRNIMPRNSSRKRSRRRH
jgi:hypothetical protein